MKKISSNNIAAIRLSIKIGQQIKDRFPEIAADYILGKSLNEIVIKYDIMNYFGKELKVSQMSVLYAIKGYSGNFQILNVEAYEGLMKKDDAESIGKIHNRENSRKIGNILYKEKRGIFKITKEERQKIGKKTAAYLVQNKLGVHAYTHEERKSKGRLGAIAQGKVPFSDEEITFIEGLAKQAEYKKGSLVKARDIAVVVNDKFHQNQNVRNANSIKKIHWKQKSKC